MYFNNLNIGNAVIFTAMEIHIHLHHHYFNKKVNLKLDKIMASIEQFESALNRIDVATTNIAEQLRDLKDQLTNAGLSAEVEAQVLARLETAATQLEAVGTSVENPVPDPEEPTE